MVSPDFKNIFRKKSHRENIFRAQESCQPFDFPYKLSLIYKGISPKITQNQPPPNFGELEKIFSDEEKKSVFFSVEQLVVYFLFRYFRALTDVCGANGATLNSIPPYVFSQITAFIYFLVS